ncbi:hypothetical protein Tco_1398931, partial [Tanacetum coccineum]
NAAPGGRVLFSVSSRALPGGGGFCRAERIFKSRTKKKAKTKQNQARNGKDKVKSQPSEENIT